MPIFSEENAFMMKNWDNVKEILDADKRLRKQLTEFLLSLEVDLKKATWWQDKWIFGRMSDSEVFISKSKWKVTDDQYAICIGIESFIPENLFGNESAATLYVWGQKNQSQLVEKLREKFKTEIEVDSGELDDKGRGTYVIKRSLNQCLPEEIDNFEDFMRKQIINHFSQYAHITNKYNRLILSNIK